MCIYIYIQYIYIERERESAVTRGAHPSPLPAVIATVKPCTRLCQTLHEATLQHGMAHRIYRKIPYCSI